MRISNPFPATAPISTADAKTHLRVSTSDEDTLIASYVLAVARRCEAYTGRALIQRNVEYFLDYSEVGASVWLPVVPVVSVTSVNVYEEDGSETTLTAGAASNYQLFGREVVPGDLGFFDGLSSFQRREVIKITYKAGHGVAASDIPEDLIQGMKLDLAEMFLHRGNTETGTIVTPIPDGAKTFYQPFRYGQLTGVMT